MESQTTRPVALITGAAGGIGRELARQLVAQGCAIAALDRSAEGLHALERDLGKSVASAIADVTNRDALQAAVITLESKLGGVDLLIASAGVGRETTAMPFDAVDFQAVLDINLIGVANSIAAVLPGMLQRRRGHLVAMSSLASFHGLPRMAGYCASKAGLNALMDSLRVELKPHGIACTTLCPGWIKTPMTADLKLPGHDLMTVVAAVRQMLQAIRQQRAFFAFPRKQARHVRLLRWLPTRWSDWLVRRFMKRMEAIGRQAPG